MKWEKLNNGDWQADGKRGDFLIWKDGKVWKSRYRSIDLTRHFFLPVKYYLKEAKKLCEKSSFWEKEN